jgi:hypothetical protein
MVNFELTTIKVQVSCEKSHKDEEDLKIRNDGEHIS